MRFQTILHVADVENTDQIAQGGDVSDINDNDVESDGSDDNGKTCDFPTPVTYQCPGRTCKAARCVEVTQNSGLKHNEFMKICLIIAVIHST